ncbi:hypothetical protein EDC94DRAFT_609335 [Helicostylum pulchrum]|nr:hypothetical protein EDC94DRAFT_609335 [Helicostylum pulchrum]
MFFLTCPKKEFYTNDRKKREGEYKIKSKCLLLLLFIIIIIGMNKSQQKRALPPTPSTSTKYTNVSDAIQSLLDTSYEGLSDRERRWHNDLSNCQKILEQKESTINNLKTIVMEWKKKATQYENAYKETQQKLLAREQFLIKQHEAELKAITKVQVDHTNDHLDIIIQLEQENQLLRQQLGQPIQPLAIHQPTSTTRLLCNNAEIANKAALESVSSNKENSEELIQRISDMVNAMEGTLHDFQNNDNNSTEDVYLQDTNPSSSIPGLISDTSSCSSADENNSDQQVRTVVPPTKKRSATIPNFLFRGNTKKKNDQEQQAMKRNQSLNESNNTWVQRKPIRINY